MMCMKTNNLSSNRRSNTGVAAHADDRSAFDPSAILTVGGGLGGRHSGVARLPVGGLATTHAPRQRTKSRAESFEQLRDVKNEGTSGDVYENKG